MATRIERGDRVLATTAFNRQVERRALGAPAMGDDFVVVRVCTEDEWEAAGSEGREPRSTPWPAEDVELLIRDAEARIADQLAVLDRADLQGQLAEVASLLPSLDDQMDNIRGRQKA